MPSGRERSVETRARRDRRRSPRPLEVVFGPTQLRDGIVDRDRLFERLAANAAHVVTIVAPAGYGKTTLMVQWAGRDPRPTAWVSIHRDDNDPAVLLASIANAAGHAGLVPADVLAGARVPSHDAPIRGAANLAASLVAAPACLLMLDGVERVTSRATKDLIAELAVRLPPGVTLVVSSRIEPPIPSPSLRAAGHLMEVSVVDLAMNESEARSLFEAEGIDLGEQLSTVVEHTEGWPVALYLVALAISVGAPREEAIRIGGDDRFVADYLRSEVLARLSPARLDFLMRTSILDHLSGPLCDHVLQTTGSAQVLDRLEASNLLIVPLDRTRTWYRYHSFLRDHLVSELDRSLPGEVAGLHLRASEWLETNGSLAPAIHHAQLAGAGKRAARLIADAGRGIYATGNVETVLNWLNWYEQTGEIDQFPELAGVAAIAHAIRGEPAEAAKWLAIIRGRTNNEAAEQNPLARMTHALIAPEDVGTMAEEAAAAVAGLGHADWLPGALVILGLATLWKGEADRADEILQRAAHEAEERTAPPSLSFALATRALIAFGQNRHEDADRLSALAVATVRRYRIEQIATSCLPFVVAARCAVHRSDIEQARRFLNEAASIRPRLTPALPGIAAATLLELAAAYVEVADIAGAREVMREVSSMGLPKLGQLETRHAEMSRLLASMPTGAVGVSTLTTAELRLLPYLVTHLSFPEIGERLFVSRHTVKTQAMSIYRKLGVSSRSEAVMEARRLGLLGA